MQKLVLKYCLQSPEQAGGLSIAKQFQLAVSITIEVCTHSTYFQECDFTHYTLFYINIFKIDIIYIICVCLDIVHYICQN